MSSPIKVRVWSDYVCPWCYVGAAEIDRLGKQYPIEVDWRPFLLRPDIGEEGWTLPASILARMNDPSSPLKARASAVGLPLVERAVVPSSRRAHECTEFARQHGHLEEFHRALNAAYWARGEDLHDWKCLKAAAAQAGLDGELMHRQVDAGEFRQQVDQALSEATELGIRAVPSSLIGEQFMIQGAQQYEVFQQAMQRLGAAAR